MSNEVKTCETCGEELKSSQFARRKPEGQPAMKASDNLVCRNYPECEKAEVEAGKQ